MNRKHLLVIGLFVIIVIMYLLNSCYAKKLSEGFTIVPNGTPSIPYTQPKQSKPINIEISAGSKTGTVAYKVNGQLPAYQKFPISSGTCNNTYNISAKQQVINSHLYGGHIAFTSDKLDSNVYLSKSSDQSWSIIVTDQSTGSCFVYIASNTKDVGLNPPYYLEVNPKTNGVKVTTIKGDQNAQWTIVPVAIIPYLKKDVTQFVEKLLRNIDIVVKMPYDHQKQFNTLISGGINKVVQSANNDATISDITTKIGSIVPSDDDLYKSYGVPPDVQSPQSTIVNQLTNSLNLLTSLCQIKSVKYGTYLTSNSGGDGNNGRGTIFMSPGSYSGSIDTYWYFTAADSTTVDNSIVEGFDVYSFMSGRKAPMFQPTLASNDFPTLTSMQSGAWSSNFAKVFNGSYIYNNSNPTQPENLLTINLNDMSKSGSANGAGTIKVNENIYNVEEITKDRLVGKTKKGDVLEAHILDGTTVNNGRPVLRFTVNGENICGKNIQNINAYCPKIDGDKITTTENKYMAMGIKQLDMKNGLGIPKVNLNVKDPNPCDGIQDSNQISQECAEFLYYGKQYEPNSDDWKKNSCTNPTFFEQELMPELEEQDYAYAKERIAQIQTRAAANDPEYKTICKNSMAYVYDGKFIRGKGEAAVYLVLNGKRYLLPKYAPYCPDDSCVVDVDASVVNDIPQGSGQALPNSTNAEVGAFCIRTSPDYTFFQDSDGHRNVWLILSGAKYHGTCNLAISDLKNLQQVPTANLALVRNGGHANVDSENGDIANFCKRLYQKDQQTPYSQELTGYLPNWPSIGPNRFTGSNALQQALEACNVEDCGGITMAPDGKSFSVRTENKLGSDTTTGEKSWIKNQGWTYVGHDGDQVNVSGSTELAYGTIPGAPNGPGTQKGNGSMQFTTVTKSGECGPSYANTNDPDPGVWKSCFIKTSTSECPTNIPYAYNADGKKGIYCCSVQPSTSSSYPSGTFDHCLGKNIKCDDPPCRSNSDNKTANPAIWGTNSAHAIWYKPEGQANIQFNRSKGELKWVDGTGKNYVWGTNVYNYIYACKQPCTNSSWVKVKGELTQLSIDNQYNLVYGVNKNNNIYVRPEDDIKSDWRRVVGTLKNISASGHGWIWGCAPDNTLWAAPKKADGITSNTWTNNSKGILTNVSADDMGNEANSNVYGISPNTATHEWASIWKHNVNPNTGGSAGWVKISDGPGTKSNPNAYINATNREWLYVTTKNSYIYRALKSDLPGAMRWQKVNGWLSQVTASNPTGVFF